MRLSIVGSRPRLRLMRPSMARSASLWRPKLRRLRISSADGVLAGRVAFQDIAQAAPARGGGWPAAPSPRRAIRRSRGSGSSPNHASNTASKTGEIVRRAGQASRGRRATGRRGCASAATRTAARKVAARAGSTASPASRKAAGKPASRSAARSVAAMLAAAAQISSASRTTSKSSWSLTIRPSERLQRVRPGRAVAVQHFAPRAPSRCFRRCPAA